MCIFFGFGIFVEDIILVGDSVGGMLVGLVLFYIQNFSFYVLMFQMKSGEEFQVVVMISLFVRLYKELMDFLMGSYKMNEK